MDNTPLVDKETAKPPDLLNAALERLQAYGLEVQIERREVQLRTSRADALVRIGHGDREATYAVELKRGLRPNALAAVIHQLERLGEQGLLVADYITPPMADALRERDIPFVDAAGNAYLNQPPLFVWVKGEKLRRAVGAGQPGSRAFQASGLQVLFALICHPQWVELPYRKIAQLANVAHGTVGLVMAELPKLGFVAEFAGKRRLVQRERLLQQWAEFYPHTLRPRLALGRFRAETLDWWETIDPARYSAVLGGEPAGGRITRHLRPGTATFYTEKLDPRLLVDLRLRADATGNLEIYRRFWTFDAQNAALAPEPLVYADLMATGEGRCIETATLIFDQLVSAQQGKGPMKLARNLGEFNRRMVEELRGTFAPTVKAFESEDGALLFRGPIQGHRDPNHIGTHVAVSLDADVRTAMERASPQEREEMIQILLSNLGTQIKVQYDAKNIGPYALDVVGTMRILRG